MSDIGRRLSEKHALQVEEKALREMLALLKQQRDQLSIEALELKARGKQEIQPQQTASCDQEAEIEVGKAENVPAPTEEEINSETLQLEVYETRKDRIRMQEEETDDED